MTGSGTESHTRKGYRKSLPEVVPEVIPGSGTGRGTGSYTDNLDRWKLVPKLVSTWYQQSTRLVRLQAKFPGRNLVHTYLRLGISATSVQF